MRSKRLLIALISAALASCASSKYGKTGLVDGLETYGLPIAGAAAGSMYGDTPQDKVIGAAAGGLGGALLSNFAFGDKHKEAGYKTGIEEGYRTGVSDAAKRHYWELQRSQSASNPEGSLQMVEVDIPPMTSEDGRVLMPRQIKMPVVE
jgi:hypothetical protein